MADTKKLSLIVPSNLEARLRREAHRQSYLRNAEIGFQEMCRIALEGGLVKLETEADGLKPKRQRKCKDDDEAAGDDEEPPSDIRFELDDEMDRRRLEVQARWSERSRDKRDCYSQPRYTLNPIGYGWINTEHERPE